MKVRELMRPGEARKETIDKMKVRELMRPIGDFPSISGNATFLEAVNALEKADWEYKYGKAPERVLLVHAEPDKIIGKISPMDVVQGLEPNYGSVDGLASSPYYRMIRSSFESMKEHYRLWHKPFDELWRRAHRIQIRDFLKMPSEDQMVHANDKMDTAFHVFVVTRHGSLFVLENSEIIGLILFSDIYKKIKESMRTSPPTAA